MSGQYIEQSLIEAQRYAAKNCSFIGAQGMLRDQCIMDKINFELDRSIKAICDPQINWVYECDYCFNESIIHNIGIKKVSRPTSKAGKSAVYAASRLSVYYSNSSADNSNWLFFYDF